MKIACKENPYGIKCRIPNTNPTHLKKQTDKKRELSARSRERSFSVVRVLRGYPTSSPEVVSKEGGKLEGSVGILKTL
jgi:hypothetical protein